MSTTEMPPSPMFATPGMTISDSDRRELMTKPPEAIVEVTQSVQSRGRQRIEEIREDKRYTPDAKAEQIKETKEQHNAKIAELRKLHADSIAADTDRIRRQLFKPLGNITDRPADKVARDASFRDALQRARATTKDADSSDLVDLLNDASFTGDDLQERAAMVVAMERGDVPALDQWLERHPSDNASISALYQRQHTTGSININEVMTLGWTFSDL